MNDRENRGQDRQGRDGGEEQSSDDCLPQRRAFFSARAQRQSLEVFRYVKEGYQALGRPIRAVKWSETQLELENRSRIVCLPCKEDSIRSFQGVALLIKDEAARIPEDVNKAATR